MRKFRQLVAVHLLMQSACIEEREAPADAAAFGTEREDSSIQADAGDAEVGAYVGETISWRLQCGNTTPTDECDTHAAHTQSNVLQRFHVSCAREEAGLHVLIEDPGFAGDESLGSARGAARPPASIEIRNADPSSNVCSVVVMEAPEFGSQLRAYVGTCGTTCNFVGAFDYMGWDFSGALGCVGLTPAGAAGPKRDLVDAVIQAPSVAISVDNCAPRTFDAGLR